MTAAGLDTGAVEAEILGSIMLNGSRFMDASRLLTANHFSDPRHQATWKAMIGLSADGEPIDVVSVAQWLIENGQGRLVDGGAYVTGLANECVGIDPDHHVRRLRRMVMQRRARQIGGQLAESDGSAEAVDAAMRELIALQQGTTNYEHTIREALSQAVDALDEAQQRDGELVGITTGLADLDKHLGGLQKSDLIVIGGRPAMGKTALMLNMAQAALKDHKLAAGVISAEQPAMQIAQRHQSSSARVPLHALRQGSVNEQDSRKIVDATRHLAGMRYWLYDRSSPTIDEVARVARHWRHQHDIDILYLDYIQRIQGYGESRVDQVGSVVSGLKTLARDLDIPVVALAQINRGVEGRPDKRPRVGDLKNSGDIEQEADQILLMYRDEVYYDDSPEKGLAEINIGKNRHGYTGPVKVAWDGATVTFSNFSATDYWEPGNA